MPPPSRSFVSIRGYATLEAAHGLVPDGARLAGMDGFLEVENLALAFGLT